MPNYTYLRSDRFGYHIWFDSGHDLTVPNHTYFRWCFFQPLPLAEKGVLVCLTQVHNSVLDPTGHSYSAQACGAVLPGSLGSILLSTHSALQINSPHCSPRTLCTARQWGFILIMFSNYLFIRTRELNTWQRLCLQLGKQPHSSRSLILLLAFTL